MYFYDFEKNLGSSVVSVEVTLPRSFQAQGDSCWLRMLLARRSLGDTCRGENFEYHGRVKNRTLEDENQDL